MFVYKANISKKKCSLLQIIPRKEKRQYKKRKHKSLSHNRIGMAGGLEGAISSDEETVPQVSPEPEEVEDEGQFVFRRNKLCSYHMVIHFRTSFLNYL